MQQGKRSQRVSGFIPESLADERVKVTILVPAKLREEMIGFGISPSSVANQAFRKEVKVRELLARWRRAKDVDPRITVADVRKKSRRIRRILGE